jgi:hypothetical protein
MSKDHLVFGVQMVIVVIEEIVVNRVIWFVYLIVIRKKNELFLFLFRVLMVYKDRKEKKVILVHPDHR